MLLALTYCHVAVLLPANMHDFRVIEDSGILYWAQVGSLPPSSVRPHMFEQAATTLAWKLLWRTVHQFIRHPYSNQWNQQPPSRWDFYLTSLFRTCYYKRSSRGPKAKCRKFFLIGSACELTSNGGSFRSKTSSLIHTFKMQDSSANWSTNLTRENTALFHTLHSARYFQRDK